MAITNFIPQIWSARLLENLRKALVYGQAGVVNRDYEGEIRQAGDRVHIHNIGPITVFDYTRNQDMPAPEQLSDERRTLVIDQAKAFNFQIDDIDAAQSNPKLMDAAMREAAYALADAADRYIASLYTGAGNAIGSDASPVNVTSSNAYDYLVDLSVVLDERNVPKTGRWVIVPPWFVGLLLKDERFVASGTTAAEERLQNGTVGRAAGFTVLESNNVPFVQGDGETTLDNYKIIAGHAMGWSYAEQINKVEAYRPERRFADAVKGLHLYGAKVVRPEALVVLSAARPAA